MVKITESVDGPFGFRRLGLQFKSQYCFGYTMAIKVWPEQWPKEQDKRVGPAE